MSYPQLGVSAKGVDNLGPRRLVCSTGLVTGVATRTPTAGQLFVWRRSSTASTLLAVHYVGARFTCTTAYGTAQRTGVDMIIARSFSASATGGTAVDMGSTVTKTGALSVAFPVSIMGSANIVRVATTDAFTAGTHTLDANPIGTLVGWTGAIGDQIPSASGGSGGDYGTLFGRQMAAGGNECPLYLAASEGFVLRNYLLMGATGVGVWDFCVEWTELDPR